MIRPTVPNSNSPIADSSGKITQIWQRFFNALVASPGAISPVVVAASPSSFTASSGGAVAISGGTISAVTLRRSGTTVAVGTSRLVPVENGDVVTVTYSAAPTMNFIPN